MGCHWSLKCTAHVNKQWTSKNLAKKFLFVPEADYTLDDSFWKEEDSPVGKFVSRNFKARNTVVSNLINILANYCDSHVITQEVWQD